MGELVNVVSYARVKRYSDSRGDNETGAATKFAGRGRSRFRHRPGFVIALGIIVATVNEEKR